MARLPNVIVPGAQKSGTTTLARLLALHPDCALARPKEPGFFCRARELREPERYARAFAHVGSERAVVDASTAYMADPAIPARARQHLGPDVRAIFILRDPASRALSAYWHLAKRGAERRSPVEVFRFDGPDLRAAVAQEACRLGPARARGRIDPSEFAERYDDALWPFRYLANGRYLEPIRRWREVFGRERVLVLLLEELAADPEGVFARVTTFLGLEPALPREALGAVHNRTRIPRRGPLARGLRRLGERPALRRLRARAPRLARWYEGALYAPRPASDRALEARLRALYAPDQLPLASELGVDLAAWWGAPGAGSRAHSAA